jgi:hypothetical protein
MRRLTLIFLVALATPGSGAASIWIANGARSPSLRVDARGNAQVTWSDRRGLHTLLVPRSGRVLPGGRSGPDVSRRAATMVPLALTVRRTPDGRMWALQRWRGATGALELHLSRWKGAPTEVTAEVAGERLTGRVTFHGGGVSGYSPTTAGRRLRVAAYVDALQGMTWRRLAGVFPRADGSFSLFLHPAWQAPRYRVTVYGKNVGWTFMPDASIEVTS